MSASVILKPIAFVVKETETRYALTGVFPPPLLDGIWERWRCAVTRCFREPKSSFNIFFTPTAAWPYLSASFGIILNQFNGFLDQWFFSPSTLGMAEGDSFFRSSKSLRGGALGSFSIDLMGFWTIDFFPSPTLRVAAGGSFHLWPARQLFGNLSETCRKSHILSVVMQTMAPNLAKPKKGKTTHNRRYFRELLEHFPTSNVKIGGTACKLCQTKHF